METAGNTQVVCFGEVLWDMLPSGAVPSGAPMNVAYHLHKLGKTSALVTRIGADSRGQQLLDLFKSKGISTDYFQTDPIYPTGIVYAKKDEKGDMRYDIVKPAAWDFIMEDPTVSSLITNAAYFVYGSLSARCEISKRTLLSLLAQAPKKVFDINLRPPYCDKETIMPLLKEADILKMNEEELEWIAPWFSDVKGHEKQMRAINEHLQLSHFFVTKGGDGAMLLTNEDFFSCEGIAVTVADTVGSGDAFLAAVLSNLLDDNPSQTVLENAVRLGSFLATKRGGMPEYSMADLMHLT